MIFNKEKKLQTCMYHVFHYSFKRLPVEKLMYGSEGVLLENTRIIFYS